MRSTAFYDVCAVFLARILSYGCVTDSSRCTHVGRSTALYDVCVVFLHFMTCVGCFCTL